MGDDLKQILMTTVDTLPALDGKIVSGGRINAKSAMVAAKTCSRPLPPVNPPQSVDFEDVDLTVGVISGLVTVTAASNELDVEYYKVYLVSRFRSLEVVGEVSANGEQTVIIEIARRVIPTAAIALVAVSGNATGEMSAKFG